MAAFLALAKARSHVAPKRLVAPGPSDEQLQLLLSAAAQAPDHGRLRPWRFILIPSERRAELGQAFVEALLARDDKALASEQQAAQDKALRAPCLLLAVVRQPAAGEAIALNERVLSLGCAIQNMLLMAQSLGLGSGITSGRAINAPPLRALAQLTALEEGICFVSLGTVAAHKPSRDRPAVADIFSAL